MGAAYILLGLILGVAINEAVRRKSGNAGKPGPLVRRARSFPRESTATDGKRKHSSNRFAAQDYYDR